MGNLIFFLLGIFVGFILLFLLAGTWAGAKAQDELDKIKKEQKNDNN